MSDLFINADDIGKVILDYIASEEFGCGIKEEDRNGFITGLGIAGTLIYARCHKYISMEEETELSAQLKQWISVNERLPKIDEAVLATTAWNDITIASRISIAEWFIHEGNTNAEIDDIIAWMPLPEPYKTDGKE